MAGRVSCVYAYLSTSTLSPDFNSTVQWVGQITICLSQHFTRASSNTVRSEDWSLMKSCNSVMRCSCSSRCTVSIEAYWRFSLSTFVWCVKRAIPCSTTISLGCSTRLAEIFDEVFSLSELLLFKT